MEIIDNVSFDDAKQKVQSGQYLMIVDRGLATKAFGNSGSVWTNLVFLPYVGIAATIALLFIDWRLAVAALFASIISFRFLRIAAVSWVRKTAFTERKIYEFFAKHHVVWFTPAKP